VQFIELIDRINPFLLNEKYYKYTFPSDPQTQMFDFYLLDYLKDLIKQESLRELPPELVESVSDAVKELYPKLREELLYALFYSISSELRHVQEHSSFNENLFGNNKKYKRIYDLYIKYITFKTSSPREQDKLKKIYKIVPPSSKVRPKSKELNTNDNSTKTRNITYKAANYAITKSKSDMSDFIKMAGILFIEGRWDISYGGEAWRNICDGWELLYNSNKIDVRNREDSSRKNIDSLETSSGISGYNTTKQRPKQFSNTVPMGVAIDHVYDLQHNNNTVFDKLLTYNKGGYEWIKDSLDFKANLSSYYDMLNLCSGTLKMMALPVLYNKLGQTWENDLKSNSPNSINSSDYITKDIHFDNVDELKRGDFVMYTGTSSFGYTNGKIYKVARDHVPKNKHGNTNYDILVLDDSGTPRRVSYTKLSKLIPKSEKPPSENPENTSPPKFSVGDVVVCIDGRGTPLVAGEKYTIKNIKKMATLDNYKYRYEVEEVPNDSFREFRFEKSEDPASDNIQPPPFKVGDVVKCVDSDSAITGLFDGKKYIVKKTNFKGLNHFIDVEGLYKSYYIAGVFAWRFEKVDSGDDKRSQLDTLKKSREINPSPPHEENFKIGDDVLYYKDNGRQHPNIWKIINTDIDSNGVIKYMIKSWNGTAVWTDGKHLSRDIQI